MPFAALEALMAKRTDPARDRLARLLRFARTRRRALIAAQDRPDPDGMACAAALKRLLTDKLRLPVVIAASGEVGRAENRAILQFLGEPLEDLDSLDLDSFDLRALVDTQPGFGNNSWPPDQPVHLVIDHHPRGRRFPTGTLADIRPDYGAASTILTEYLRAADIDPDPQLATVLLYGIKTDTQDLSRAAAAADTEAFLYLYPRANQRLLAKIERERLPRDYFALLARALLRCRLYDNVAICPVGTVASPDLLSEMADFFLRIEGIRWSLCHGAFDGQLHLSLRTILRQGNAGQVMAAALEDIGDGGGHDMMAGGQVPLTDDTPEAIDALARDVELRFLRQLEVPTRTPEPLVPDLLTPNDTQQTRPQPPGDAPKRVGPAL
jgi:nanoRNase/pAp phosphatase (c-di-AMP/oligoRNAs hydrolase)